MVEAVRYDFDEAEISGKKFDPDTCISLLKKLNEDPEVDVRTFTSVLLEFVKIINEMSSALSIAFKGSLQTLVILFLPTQPSRHHI